MQVADVSVAMLQDNRVAVAYRDVSRDNRGYVMFGQAGLDGIAWGYPVKFSNESQASGTFPPHTVFMSILPSSSDNR